MPGSRTLLLGDEHDGGVEGGGVLPPGGGPPGD